MSTKKQSAEREESIKYLRETLKPGDTVYTILRHVSRSGMQREISLFVATCDGGQGDLVSITYRAAVAMQDRVGKRDGIIVGGCGMDMGYALVHTLSYTVFKDGYACVGRGRCPSADHRNPGPDRDKYGRGVRHKDGYALVQRWL